MKKTKLLMPLVGIAAAGTAIAPIVTLTSCQKDNTIPESMKIVVVFIPNNGGDPIVESCIRGSTVGLPETPKKENCVFAGWYTDSSFTHEFDPTEPVEKNTVVYAKWFDEGYYATAPRIMKLPFSNDANTGYTTTKTFEVYTYKDSKYTKVQNVEYVSDRPLVANVDENGEITIASDAEEGQFANIYAYNQTGDVIASTKVYPVKARESIDFSYFATRVAFKEYFVDEDYNCVVPDKIIKADQASSSEIYLDEPQNADTIKDMLSVKNLFLPANFSGIETNVKLWKNDNARLLNVFFNGTASEFASTWASNTDWMGTQVVTVRCTDADYTLKNRYETEIKTIDDQLSLATSINKGSSGSLDVTIRMNYSKYYYDLLAENHFVIEGFGLHNPTTEETTKLRPIVWNEIYLDGKKLTYLDDYTCDYTGGATPRLIIGGSNDTKVSASSNLVIKASLYFEGSEDITIGCTPNYPEVMKIRVHAKEGYKTTDKFTITGLQVYEQWNDGSKYDVDHRWLEFHLDTETGTELIVGTTVMNFTPGAHKVIIVDTLTGLQTEYSITIS